MNKKEDTSKRGRPKSPACICQLPPPAPPYTGGELITKQFLPLCKGGVSGGSYLKLTFGQLLFFFLVHITPA